VEERRCLPHRHPDRRAGARSRAYRRHEVAHCNGWEHSHASVVVRDQRGRPHHVAVGASGGSVGDIARENDRLAAEAQ